MEFERFDVASNHTHSIDSRNVMVEKETGRVVAVFYNDYDMNDVLDQLDSSGQLESNEELNEQITYLKQAISNIEYLLWESMT